MRARRFSRTGRLSSSPAAPASPARGGVNIGRVTRSSGPPEARSQWTFQPIADARVHERVVDQITFAIRSGAYAVGERLPSVEPMVPVPRIFFRVWGHHFS